MGVGIGRFGSLLLLLLRRSQRLQETLHQGTFEPLLLGLLLLLLLSHLLLQQLLDQARHGLFQGRLWLLRGRPLVRERIHEILQAGRRRRRRCGLLLLPGLGQRLKNVLQGTIRLRC